MFFVIMNDPYAQSRLTGSNRIGTFASTTDPNPSRTGGIAPGESLRLIIDSDAANEIDDLYAIALALRAPARFRIEGFVATHFAHLLPTLVDLCGLTALEEHRLDGISLASVLRGEAQPPADRMLFVNYSRMPRNDSPTPDTRSVMRSEDAGVLRQHWRLPEQTELYDLRRDPM